MDRMREEFKLTLLIPIEMQAQDVISIHNSQSALTIINTHHKFVYLSKQTSKRG